MSDREGLHPGAIVAIVVAVVITFIAVVAGISMAISDSGGTFETSQSSTSRPTSTTTTPYSTTTTTKSTGRSSTSTSTTTSTTTTTTPSTRTTTQAVSPTTQPPAVSVVNEYSIVAVTPMTCGGTPVTIYTDGAQQNMGLYGSPKLTTTASGALLTFASKPDGFSFSKLVVVSDTGNVFSGDGAEFSSANINGPTNVRIASSYAPQAVTMCS